VDRLFTLGLANAAAATVLALLVAVLGRTLALRPAVRHSLWLLVLLKLVTPPLFEVSIQGFQGEPPVGDTIAGKELELDAVVVHLEESRDGAQDTASIIDVPSSPGLNEAGKTSELEQASRWFPGFSLLQYLPAAWVAGTVAVALLAILRVARFQSVLRGAELAPDEVQEQVAELAGRLGLACAPRAWHIDSPLTPMLWAVGCKPRLIIPRELWKQMGSRARTMLLVHELAHLRRGDHLVRFFELGVTALFWWLPIVWWARKALREAEEQCCDAWVVWAYPEDVRTYAETLLETVDYLNPSRSPVPLLASGFGRAHHLELQRRLTMIMLGTTPRRLSIAGALGTFGFSALLLPLTPTLAQKPGEKTTTQAITIEVKDDGPEKAGQEVKSEVRVFVASDGDVQEVKTDSVAKAVEVLKQRIEALAKEKGGSEGREAQIKALKEAIGQLEKSKSVTYTVQAREPKEPAREVVLGDRLILRGEHDPSKLSPVSPDKKARIDQAKKRIEVLQKDLVTKQKQLAEAQLDLAKLSADMAFIEVKDLPPHVILKADPARIERSRIIVGKPAEVREGHLEFKTDHPAQVREDHDRLEALEAKLSKLLDEVASLRKQRESKTPEAK
jgi:beta-lactamase regulating signal transducer with metallopeptidase domain